MKICWLWCELKLLLADIARSVRLSEEVTRVSQHFGIFQLPGSVLLRDLSQEEFVGNSKEERSNAIVGVVTTGFECLPPSCDGLTGPDDHGPMISRLIDRGIEA
ncbi:hypothetical protein F511_34616 [Dorcoceras hygrometricum]|uniref:Uncharacterized protein n=1 Tax=Dorcoceras hygrometricum TaxID=472368 RepID=A0A2Z7CAV1_9LAMI|nr:hypothetical protein F511_34616 [Dorcoceras hygrometricum]